MGLFRVVLQVLKEHQLFTKYSKCEFWLGSVAFIISIEVVEVELKETEVVRNLPIRLAPIDIRGFLGLAG